MRSLKQLVEESLVSEAKTINYVAFWDHYNPSELYCVKDAGEGFATRVADATDWNASHLSGSRLVSIMWNDESLYCSDVPGNNLNDAKKKDLKNIEDQLKKQEGSDGVYIESDIFGGGSEWYDDAVPKTAQETLDRFIEIMEHSRVDGDSGYARALVDIKTGKVLLGRDNISFMSADEFLEMVGIEED